MDDCCLVVAIRQRACQNGVPITSDKLYSNINSMEQIVLNFGYTVTLSTFGSNDILINFVNTTLGINLNFSITNPGIGIFDLPIDGGTFRVIIAAEQKCCFTIK